MMVLEIYEDMLEDLEEFLFNAKHSSIDEAWELYDILIHGYKGGEKSTRFELSDEQVEVMDDLLYEYSQDNSHMGFKSVKMDQLYNVIKLEAENKSLKQELKHLIMSKYTKINITDECVIENLQKENEELKAENGNLRRQCLYVDNKYKGIVVDNIKKEIAKGKIEEE